MRPDDDLILEAARMSSEDSSPKSRGGLLSSLRWVVGGKTDKASHPQDEPGPAELAEDAGIVEASAVGDDPGADDPAEMILSDAVPEAPVSDDDDDTMGVVADEALILGPSMQSSMQPGAADEESAGDDSADDNSADDNSADDEAADDDADDAETGEIGEIGETDGNDGEDQGASETTTVEDTAHGVDEDGVDEDKTGDDDTADDDMGDEAAVEAAGLEIPDAEDVGDTREDAMEQAGEVLADAGADAGAGDDGDDETGDVVDDVTGDMVTGVTGDLAAILGENEPDEDVFPDVGDIVEDVKEEDEDGLIRALAGQSVATVGHGVKAAADKGLGYPGLGDAELGDAELGDPGQDEQSAAEGPDRDAWGEPGLAAIGAAPDAWALEETIRRVIHEEMTGELGQRLSLNIERMIREQVAMAMRRRE